MNENSNLETSLNDFQILQEIGKGSFGNVYKVRRIKDGEIYALKKVSIENLKQKEKENSLNEIRILASINHPNVIAYKEAFLDKHTGYLCIIMECADCGDLEKKINSQIKCKTLINEKDVLSYLIQILQGLKALHDKQIIHRDIKAANIFMFESNLVKLGDLNVSKVFKSGVHLTQTGTPYYASPEVWCDKPYDFKTDIWSLGCLLYEMLTLKAPFRGTTMKAVYEKVMKGVYDAIPAFYSKHFVDILKMTLHKNPNDRPTCDKLLEFVNEKFSHVINIEDNYRNFHSESEIEKSPLLSTIKIPQRMFQLNQIMPRSKYIKKLKISEIKLKHDESSNLQSKVKLDRTEIPKMNSRNSLDVSEFYNKQFKMIDELLKETSKNKLKEEQLDLTHKDDKSYSHDPVLNVIQKPILIKNKIIHNLKNLQKNEESKKFQIENKAEHIQNENIQKSFIKNINKIDNLLSNLKIKITSVEQQNIKNGYNLRCVSANSNHIRNNSNNIRRVFNQDVSYITNDKSVITNMSALPVIENRQYIKVHERHDKPVRLNVPYDINDNEKKNKNYNSDKNIFEIKNIKSNINKIYNNIDSQLQNMNYHYNDVNIKQNKNISRVMLNRRNVYELRPLSQINNQRIKLEDDRKYIKGINMVHM